MQKGSSIDGVLSVPGTVRNVLCLFHFISIVVMGDGCHYAYFINEEMEA